MGLAKTYLLAYNASLILGWGYVLVLAGIAFAIGAAPRCTTPWRFLLLAQTAACLEVVHAMVGIARSPVLVTAMQVSPDSWWSGRALRFPPSRVATLPLAIGGVELGLGVPSLLLCWGVTGSACATPSLLLQAPRLCSPRHHLGPLHLLHHPLPLGVSSELWCAYSGFPHLVKSGALSYAMPNPRTTSRRILPNRADPLLPRIRPRFPMLYTYMLKQRKSVLSPAKKKRA